MWTSFCSELVLLEDVSIVVQSGLDRSHSQTSHIKYEDTPLFVFFSFEEVFQKTSAETLQVLAAEDSEDILACDKTRSA